jgi:phosphoribosylamine--glycine ligase
VSLADVAQDNAVEMGTVDRLRAQGIPTVGPTRAAGKLEWSKGHARDFMAANAIPHPSYKICASEQDGIDFIESQPDQGWVIKADGLAEGKGVYVKNNAAEAIEAIREMKKFKQAGATFLVEKRLQGREFSTFALSDGNDFQVLGHAQDHKLQGTFDTGLNTGGMGCSTPPLFMTEAMQQQVRQQILEPTFSGMQKIGEPYTGVLYLGGMVEEETGTPSVIEYNSRWGDPEAQTLAPLIETDFFELMMAAANGTIKDVALKIRQTSRVVVTAASRGYPGDYSGAKGKQVFGIDDMANMDGVTFYGAGIKEVEGKHYASGGRLGYVAGEGQTVVEARERAYAAMARLHVDGNNMQYRTDIGWQDVDQLRNQQ